ncbi:Coagulation factor XIII B chain [Varanus komodoensis]|nr:Coagulation factor XIII B chain [Varanus komodoensis]
MEEREEQPDSFASYKPPSAETRGKELIYTSGFPSTEINRETFAGKTPDKSGAPTSAKDLLIRKADQKCARPPLHHGVFSDTKLSFKIWESLQYSCDSGYRTPEGSSGKTIQCLQDGWSSVAQCMETSDTCSAPDLSHGHYHTVQRVFNLNEKLKYECDDGYLTAGGNTMEEALCHPQGWSLFPKCTKLQCSLLSPIEHGGVYPSKGSYDEGDVVQFFCLEGYSLEGPELIQCYNFGWYPKPPVCEERRNKCPSPPQPPNAKLPSPLRTFHHGDTLHLQCEPPFQIRGSDEIRCENGKWTSPPKCTDTGRSKNMEVPLLPEMERNCSSPPVVKHGLITSAVNPWMTSYKTGSLVEYRCVSFHVMKGPKAVTCVHGSWTEPPVCSEPCLIDEETVGIYNIELKWTLEELNFLHGEVIEFVCKPGYVLPPSISESQLLVQCVNGELRYPKCILRDPSENCGPPPSIRNGILTRLVGTDYAPGSSAEYSCHEYHFLQGSRTVSCSREPCILSHEEMAKNNLDMRWSFDNRPYFLHGEFVEFICKPYHVRQYSTSESDFRVQCRNGTVLYPRCIDMQG